MPTPAARSTLFHKDGVSLYATNVDCDDHEGIILTLTIDRNHEKNVVNPALISLLIEALDTIDSHPKVSSTNNKALIITGLSLEDTSSPSKFFSNGLDLQWMLTAGNGDAKSVTQKSNPASKLIESFNSQVLARILTLPFRTIAAINGHCIGAGLFLALACDYRLMRTQRGYLQWPEARLGMRLTKGFAELSKAKIRHAKISQEATDYDVLREGILTAKKYTPREGLASGIIDGVHPIEKLYECAFQLAKDGLPESLSGMNLEYFDPKGYSEIKMEMYTDAYRALKYGKVEDTPHSRI